MRLSVCLSVNPCECASVCASAAPSAPPAQSASACVCVNPSLKGCWWGTAVVAANAHGIVIPSLSEGNVVVRQPVHVSQSLKTILILCSSLETVRGCTGAPIAALEH